ncbi:MAG: BglG family transcription antiterminator [Hespellia sp.]|nr:BglG family transcription antiterminator [Hespellia sp.]
MEFTPRVKQILRVLLQETEVMPVKILAERVGVSKRTVQRELDYIGYVLKKYHLQLCSKTGAGIWLEGENEQREVLLADLEQQKSSEFADKDERRKALMLELLKDQVPKKLYYYANLFAVSEATVSKDIEHVEPWFEKFQLQIFRKPGYGVALVGAEKDYRIAVREFITKYMDTPVLNGLYEDAEVSVTKKVGTNSIRSRYKLLNEDVLRRVGICLASFPDERIKYLTEESYVGLIIHITIAMERVLAGEIIESNEELKNKLQQDRDYDLAELVVSSLEREFEVEIPDIEIVYICLHIKGSKLQRADTENKNDDMRKLVEELIVVYDERLSVELGADEELVNGLAAHLQPTLVRLRNHMLIENPHLQEIKERYPEVYENSSRVGRAIGEKYGYEVPEEEVGFLAMHFGAALVRLEEQREKKRVVYVGLVCASGIGISRLMASRLKKYLRSQVKLSTYGKDDLKPIVLERNDFFVSSINLGEIDSEVVQVNPLLPEEDLIRVEKVVRKYSTTERPRQEETDFVKQVEQINMLAGEMKEILENFQCIEVPEEITFQELLETAAEHITPYEENRKRLVKEIKAREELATQVLPELDIALLHARSHSVFQASFCVCVPKAREGFTDPYMQSVKAAVIMLVPDDIHKEEAGKMLGYLSESLIEDDVFLMDVKSGNRICIKESLSRLLKHYFSKYLDTV